MSKRKEFPTAVKVAAWKRCDAKCERCGAVLKAKAFDHINPDAITGKPTLENCQVLCLPCHKEKTAADIAAIAQAKRREAKHIGATARKASFPKRPKPERPRRDQLPLPPRQSVYREIRR